MNPPIHILCGPTASGKSARALELAEKTGGVIINADSQQMYGDLRVLTARPTPEDEARVPHRLYGVLGAEEPCSAGIWLRRARMEIDWARSEGKPVIVVGGTGLYLKALMEGIAEIPDVDPALRAQAANDLAEMGGKAFRERLMAVDSAAERLKDGDTQRLIRAWEVWLATAKPLSWWQAQGKMAPYPGEAFQVEVVELPRAELYARINARVLQMMEEGAVEEVRGLGSGEWGVKHAHSDLFPQSPIPNPLLKIIGVREILGYLHGEMQLEKTVGAIQQATRNYAKRQVTWFRHQLS